MLEICNLVKSRQDGTTTRKILDGVNISLSSGESLSIMGDSGSGKSTLLNIIAGLESADTGKLVLRSASQETQLHRLSNKEYTAWRKQHLGIVFQQFNLIECLNVIDNIKFPTRLNQNLDEGWLDTISQQLNIKHLWSKPIQNISGGEQQRVAVARAVAHKPTLVLADEPTGNLDHQNAMHVIDLLTDICKTSNTPLILVTHSHSIASKTDKQLRLENGQLMERIA